MCGEVGVEGGLGLEEVEVVVCFFWGGGRRGLVEVGSWRGGRRAGTNRLFGIDEIVSRCLLRKELENRDWRGGSF